MPSALRKLFDLSGPVVPTAASGQKGRAGLQVYSPDATDLQSALDQDQFFAMYQPKISCFSGDLVGFEALMRWDHPQHGFIPPDRFIASAENTGMIDALTERMLDISLSWFAPRYARSSVRLSINLSARSRLDDAFVDKLLARCTRAGVPADQLIFELTETSAMEDPVASLDLLTRMRMKGFHLSIDDLGTGFSSLLQLVRLPFSELKVDKSFVITAAVSSESRQVIQAIVSLGQSLGIQSTAEGVEDATTLQFLREIGCNFAQGFHIARPMEKDAAANWTHFTLP
jgi:EAL domain-containing protein (putative c-di-GMP-specific phosphodiesterase class I)